MMKIGALYLLVDLTMSPKAKVLIRKTFLDLSDAWYIYTSFLVMAAEDGVVDDHVEPHQFHVL